MMSHLSYRVGMGGIRELLDGNIWEWDLSFRWEWNGNGNEVIKWERIGTKNLFPHTSSPPFTSASTECIQLPTAAVRTSSGQRSPASCGPTVRTSLCWAQSAAEHFETETDKKLCYRRRTARRAMSVEILSTAAQPQEQVVGYNKSTRNRSSVEHYGRPTCSKLYASTVASVFSKLDRR